MTSRIRLVYKPPFARFVKKAPSDLAMAIWDEVEVVCEAPAIGELKTGDLSGFRVHKFKFHGQEYLLAYLPSVSDPEPRDGGRPTPVISFYQLGPHENFYLSLKQYVKRR